MKRLISRKVCFEQLTEFLVKKTSDRPSNLHLDTNDFCTLSLSYQDQLALFNLHLYDEFLVMDVLIVLLYM